MNIVSNIREFLNKQNNFRAVVFYCNINRDKRDGSRDQIIIQYWKKILLEYIVIELYLIEIYSMAQINVGIPIH